MSTKEIKKTGEYQINFRWISYLPIMALLGIIPLIVRLSIVQLDEQAQKALGVSVVNDFFSQYKSTFILIAVAVMVFVFFLTFEKSKIKKDKIMLIYYISSMVFAGLSLLSALCSDQRQIALWGIADRFEGAVVILAYIGIMLYTSYLFEQEKDYKYIVFPLAFVTLVAAILGYTQYIGKDFLLMTDTGLKLIVPEKYASMRSMFKPQYSEKRAYATFFHYNYVGSFTAMMISLFIPLALFIKGIWKKLIFAIVALMAILLLMMSTSRAGIIGIGLSLVVMLILLGKLMIKKWKLTLPAVIVVLVLIVGVNAATQGAIFERIPSLLKDATELFDKSKQPVDLVAQLPIQDITHQDGKISFHSKDNQLIVENEIIGKLLKFTDQTGAEVAKDIQNGIYVITDERFQGFTFGKITDVSDDITDWRLDINGQFTFCIRQNLTDGIHLFDSVTMETIELDRPETFGFKGKERLGSARGYIWSRSIPMLKDNLILGNGPDTYVFHFPQRDYIGKWAAYNTTNMVVDKPHNLYLQVGLNEGVLALIAFLTLVGTYLVQGFRLYTFRTEYTQQEIIGIGMMLAVVGYLGAGIFNDSVVAVAPIFWALLGFGIGLNYKVSHERRKIEKEKEHAIINMKTKKHI